jgi:hypothetical protein
MMSASVGGLRFRAALHHAQFLHGALALELARVAAASA